MLFVVEMALTSLGRCRFQSVELLKDETLGIGSYGKVCKARCDNLVCAAKILHPTFFGTNDPGARMFVEKFQQECEFLRFVTHPNIVQCLGTFHDYDGPQRLPVLLLELMDESLTHFLKRSKEPLSYFTEVTISHDVALALSFLHSNGYIHRDLSSNNILLIAGTRAKVADFGMCRLIDANAKMMTTCPGTVVYMPPEALREPPKYTDKIDTFSFGVVLVQIMTRLFPDPGPARETINETTEKIVAETKRRENHIKLVEPNHPLLQVALNCLKNTASERASARELCHNFEVLKQSPFYLQNKVAEERVNLAFFQKEQRELRKKFTQDFLVREKEIIEQLDETATKRVNALKHEIKVLREQLNDQMSLRDSQHCDDSEVFRPRLANIRSVSLQNEVFCRRGFPVMSQQQEDTLKETAGSRERNDSIVHESIDDWQVPQSQIPPKEPENLYNKWNIRPLAGLSGDSSRTTSRLSVTSQYIDFRSTSDHTTGPSLDQVLASRMSEVSPRQEGSEHPHSSHIGVNELEESTDDLSHVEEYLRSSNIEQPDYYNLHSLQAKDNEPTYYNRHASLPTPKRNIQRPEYLSRAYHAQVSNPGPTSSQVEASTPPTYSTIPEGIEESSDTVARKYANVDHPSSSFQRKYEQDNEYDYVDDGVFRSLPLKPLPLNDPAYVNTRGSVEQPRPNSPDYENKEIIAMSELASSPNSNARRPVPKPRKLPPRSTTLKKSLSVSPTNSRSISPTSSLPVACYQRITSDSGSVFSSSEINSPTTTSRNSSHQEYRRASSPSPSTGTGSLLSPNNIFSPNLRSDCSYQDYRILRSPSPTVEGNKLKKQVESGNVPAIGSCSYQDYRRASSPTPESSSKHLLQPSERPQVKPRSLSNPLDPTLDKVANTATQSLVNLAQPTPQPRVYNKFNSTGSAAHPTDSDFQWKCIRCSQFTCGSTRVCATCGHNKDHELSTEWYTYC